MSGTFIVIDGLDGSGKGTQTALVAQRLRNEGFQVELADFPQYGKPSAYFVERYLRGEFGSATEVSAKMASLFYALDRFDASFQIKSWLAEGKIVIANRYVSANKGHQLGKLPTNAEKRAFLDWINEMEYGTLRIPVPQLTIFLHMNPEIGQQLVDQKEVREYTHGKKRDIHEADITHLRNAEQAYLFCCQNDTREKWVRISCFTENSPRPVSEVHQEICALIYASIKK